MLSSRGNYEHSSLNIGNCPSLTHVIDCDYCCIICCVLQCKWLSGPFALINDDEDDETNHYVAVHSTNSKCTKFVICFV